MAVSAAPNRSRAARSPKPPGARYRVLRPSARAMSTWGSSERSQASSDFGITRPEVPSTESPPSTPSRGLKVRRAISSPPGMLTVTRRGPAGNASRTAAAIIVRGTGLMAGSPGSS